MCERAALADGVSCRSSPGASRCVCTVRSRMTLRLTQWTAAGRRPGGGATVPQGSADYRTPRQRLRVGAEGQVPVVFSSIKGLRHPLCPIQPHETVRQVTAGPSCGEAPDMQDGRWVRGAGLLGGFHCPARGGVARAPEARGGLCDTGTVLLGRAGRAVLWQSCLLCTGGQEARRCLGPRQSVHRWPVRGARGRLRRRPSALLVMALPLAQGLVPPDMQDMRGLGVGSRRGLPLRRAPRIWRIIPQASSGIRAGGAVPAPLVGVSSLPARPGG